jgi:hypothetical protein
MNAFPLDVSEIVAMHADCVRRWHVQPIDNPNDGFLGVACQQHRFNFELWHQEDIARSPDVTDTEIAQVKRAIDRLNQQRNDWIEKLDDWLTAFLEAEGIQPAEDARLNSETPGSIVDRLSILALRLFHLEEQLERQDADMDHREKVKGRLEVCRLQQRDLAKCLSELLADVLCGKKRHRTYRQFKMYNDPTLNPYLYRRATAAGQG